MRGPTQHILRMHGYTVHETHDGMAALDLVHRQAMHIDLLITDIVMPGLMAGNWRAGSAALCNPCESSMSQGIATNCR